MPSVGLEAAILQQAAVAAQIRADPDQAQQQVSLGGLVSDLTAVAHNEAKVRAPLICKICSGDMSVVDAACLRLYTACSTGGVTAGVLTILCSRPSIVPCRSTTGLGRLCSCERKSSAVDV